MLKFKSEEVFLLGTEELEKIGTLITTVYGTKVTYDILEYGEFSNGSCIEVDLRKISSKLSTFAASERERFLHDYDKDQDEFGLFLQPFMIGLVEEGRIPEGKYIFHIWW